ncbi:UNVERIFIED_CONTAM: hypothetical protein HDU68_000359 [Siphonaria sp. JEL0065]|nr:hypothetical protein HDU68_000359 [Siphonaria sp. JEL0065]
MQQLPQQFSVLLLGDGNFSFSLALSRALFDVPLTFDDSAHTKARRYLNIPDHVNTKNIRILATSFDSRDQLLRKYLDFAIIEKNLSKFSNNVKLMHQINAWELGKMFTPATDAFDESIPRWTLGQRPDGSVGFDTVAWNHPHLGTEDFRLHRFLMAHFFHSVSSVLNSANTSSSVVVSLVSGQEIRWDLSGQASRSNLILSASDSPFPFTEQDWPGYVVKRNMHGKSFKNEATKKRMADEMKSFGFRFVRASDLEVGEVPAVITTTEQLASKLGILTVASNGSVDPADTLVPKYLNPQPAVLIDAPTTTQIPTTKEELNKFPLPDPLACPYCLKVFLQPRAYKQHVLQIHILKQRGDYWVPNAPRTFPCRGWPDSNVAPCQKQFSSDDGRWQHEVIKHSQFNEGELIPSFEVKSAADLLAMEANGEEEGQAEAAVASIEPFLDITDEPTDDADYYPCEICAQAVARRPWGMALHLETLKPIVGLDMKCPNTCNHTDGDKLFIERRALWQHYMFCRLKK